MADAFGWRISSWLIWGSVATALFGACLPALAQADQARPSCQGVDAPVSVGSQSTVMHGTLCLPAGQTPGTVMVLVPGSTYNHIYWDFTYQPAHYDFRLAMNEAGYATFVVDRLGTGLSSRPPSASVSSTVQASAVHQVIQALRAGQIGGVGFPKVLLGGHSLGSMISLIEAWTYHDEDALLLTGISHNVNSAPSNPFYSADQDPAFAGKGYDPGYFTTRQGTRGGLFYAPGTTNPKVVATDEATKDVASYTELPDGLGATSSLDSSLIQVPVLIADGSLDRLACNAAINNCASAAAMRASEAPYFSAAACLHTYLLLGSGHDINLATNTTGYQKAVRAWADTFVGPGPGPASPPPGSC